MSSNIIEKLAAISAKYPPGCRYSADNTKFRPFAINYCRSLGSIPLLNIDCGVQITTDLDIGGSQEAWSYVRTSIRWFRCDMVPRPRSQTQSWAMGASGSLLHHQDLPAISYADKIPTLHKWKIQFLYLCFYTKWHKKAWTPAWTFIDKVNMAEIVG